MKLLPSMQIPLMYPDLNSIYGGIKIIFRQICFFQMPCLRIFFTIKGLFYQIKDIDL